jgi:hypothetical protein
MYLSLSKLNKIAQIRAQELTMILLNPVQPNFIKALVIASISVSSLNAFADHHGGTDQKTNKAGPMSKHMEEADSTADVAQSLREDELRIKMDDEKARNEMKKMMAKDPKKKSDAI